MNYQGWECPKCGRVYSPNTPMCMYCCNQTIIRANMEDTGWKDIIIPTRTDGKTVTVEWTNKDVLSNEENIKK